MSPLLILLLGAGLSSASVALRRSSYRDYTYVEEFNAFYKFYCDNNGGNWSSTYKACEEEGAELFYPRELDEWTIVKKLVEAQPHPSIVSNVFVGKRGKINVTSSWRLNTYGEGKCVTLNMDTGDLIADECTVQNGIPRSFVCKKAADVARGAANEAVNEILYLMLCKNNGYQYDKETKMCYKVHNERKTWSDARDACRREGGHLLILKSEAEVNLIKNKLSEYYLDYYIGVSKSSSSTDYYTILGDKVNLVAGIIESVNYGKCDCATIWTSKHDFLLIDSTTCNTEFPFVCEINN